MYYMCLPVFLSLTDKRQLGMSVHVYMLFTNILPEAICCCLETCNSLRQSVQIQMPITGPY